MAAFWEILAGAFVRALIYLSGGALWEKRVRWKKLLNCCDNHFVRPSYLLGEKKVRQVCQSFFLPV